MVFPRLLKASENLKVCVPCEICQDFLPFEQSGIDHYQYLVSTHSADLLGHRAVERIYHVQLRDGQTQVDLLDKNDVDAMRLLMLEMGASISELYGAERILWVEGPTEERGFKDILKAFYDMSSVDCVLVGVHHTGDFEQKKSGQKRLIFNVYRKLSEAHSLLPKSNGFDFEREGRSKTEIRDLEHIGRTA